MNKRDLKADLEKMSEIQKGNNRGCFARVWKRQDSQVK